MVEDKLREAHRKARKHLVKDRRLSYDDASTILGKYREKSMSSFEQFRSLLSVFEPAERIEFEEKVLGDLEHRLSSLEHKNTETISDILEKGDLEAKITEFRRVLKKDKEILASAA